MVCKFSQILGPLVLGLAPNNSFLRAQLTPCERKLVYIPGLFILWCNIPVNNYSHVEMIN